MDLRLSYLYGICHVGLFNRQRGVDASCSSITMIAAFTAGQVVSSPTCITCIVVGTYMGTCEVGGEARTPRSAWLQRAVPSKNWIH